MGPGHGEPERSPSRGPAPLTDDGGLAVTDGSVDEDETDRPAEGLQPLDQALAAHEGIVDARAWARTHPGHGGRVHVAAELSGRRRCQGASLGAVLVMM
jgi:hypothetical protein